MRTWQNVARRQSNATISGSSIAEEPTRVRYPGGRPSDEAWIPEPIKLNPVQLAVQVRGGQAGLMSCPRNMRSSRPSFHACLGRPGSGDSEPESERALPSGTNGD